MARLSGAKGRLEDADVFVVGRCLPLRGLIGGIAIDVEDNALVTLLLFLWRWDARAVRFAPT